MATEKWVAGSGVGFTWTQCFATADLTSLANGSSVLSSQGDITNQTALDIFADISFNLASLTVAAPAKLDFFIYPQNQDGSTYGDGAFTAGTQAATTPSSSLWVGSFVMQTGAAAKNGIVTGLIIPPGTFRFCLQNNAGVAFSASTNAIKYRSYNRSIA